MSLERWITPCALLLLFAIAPNARAVEVRAAVEDSSAAPLPALTAEAIDVELAALLADDEDDDDKPKAKKSEKDDDEDEDDDKAKKKVKSKKQDKDDEDDDDDRD